MRNGYARSVELAGVGLLDFCWTAAGAACWMPRRALQVDDLCESGDDEWMIQT
eukprot:CAMPEP_0184388768 /NCGR_PEP_ID=MMETSP0007-20130409/11904_1 /TAXON_ID=97485 /ORGANISM="Prymnesium parvum, Strain Texoma1" /LENGTH=52 /DNA_ID=CAMNT_0026737773 /DNA_START=71 /DNA_END=225 /DNA_ORIENTATION=+